MVLDAYSLGRGPEQVKTGQANLDHLSGHFRGHFCGCLRGTFRGSFRGESLKGWEQAKSTLMGAVVGALVGGSSLSLAPCVAHISAVLVEPCKARWRAASRWAAASRRQPSCLGIGQPKGSRLSRAECSSCRIGQRKGWGKTCCKGEPREGGSLKQFRWRATHGQQLTYKMVLSSCFHSLPCSSILFQLNSLFEWRSARQKILKQVLKTSEMTLYLSLDAALLHLKFCCSVLSKNLQKVFVRRSSDRGWVILGDRYNKKT